MWFKDSSDKSWNKYGVNDPYFGVLTSEKFRKENLNDDSLKDFFNSGAEHIDHVHEVIKRVFGDTVNKSALDFGCGVGRLLIPLSKYYRQVTGVDIAPSMLLEASSNCRKFNINNVSLLESDDQLSKVCQKFDFVHSVIVLQHIPRSRGMKIIKRLMNLTADGGIMMIHVNLTRNSSRIIKSINFFRKFFVPFHWLINLLSRKRYDEPFMQMNSYNLNLILLEAYANHFNEFFIEKYHNNEYPGVLLFGKKQIKIFY